MTFKDVEIVKSQDIYSTCVPSSVNSIGIVVDELINSLKNCYGAVNDMETEKMKINL